jgi:hypothetical protein
MFNTNPQTLKEAQDQLQFIEIFVSNAERNMVTARSNYSQLDRIRTLSSDTFYKDIVRHAEKEYDSLKSLQLRLEKKVEEFTPKLPPPLQILKRKDIQGPIVRTEIHYIQGL